MKDIPEELREKVKKYSLMMAWWYIFEKEKDIENKLTKVLEKIEQTENELKVSGLEENVFDEIIKRAKRFVNMTMGEMTDNQRLTICKLIFGQETKFA